MFWTESLYPSAHTTTTKKKIRMRELVNFRKDKKERKNRKEKKNGAWLLMKNDCEYHTDPKNCFTDSNERLGILHALKQAEMIGVII